MKKTLIIAGVIAALSFAACENGGTTAPAAVNSNDSTAVAGSIVYFNLDEVMAGYDMANDLQSRFQTKANSLQAEFDRRSNSIQHDANEFQSKVDRGLLTSSVANAQLQRLQQRQSEYQQYVATKSQELGQEQEVMMNTIYNAIAEYVKAYNEEHNFAMVLATTENLTKNLLLPVVTADPALDITQEILDGLNAQYILEKQNANNNN